MISEISDYTVVAGVRWTIASVWLVHGLYNKLLGGSPRHLAIVRSVPGLAGARGARTLTLVGVGEVALAFWVLAGWQPVWCAAVQTGALLSMNLLELRYARSLLLWPAGLVPLNLLFLALGWVAAGAPRVAVGCAAAAVALGGGAAIWPAIVTRLRRHPLPIEARLEDCVTLTYALPAHVLRPMLPPGLELETVGPFGFLAVAFVQARALRPVGLPPSLGQDFFLAGYRIFSRFRTAGGAELRGLRILRSDANRRRMVAGGNLLTHYRYRHCDAAVDRTADRLRLHVSTPDHAGDVDLSVNLSRGALPPGSPFASIREARRFAGPLLHTFDYEPETDAIVSIRANRTNWRPVLVDVETARLGFFDRPEFAGCRPTLAAAFHVSHVDYRWERGVRNPLPRRLEVTS